MPQRKNVELMTTGPHTFPTTDSCRILSCIITPCNVDNPNCITCDTSHHIHHLSCRDAEQDYLPLHYPSQGFELAFAPSLYPVVRHAGKWPLAAPMAAPTPPLISVQAIAFAPESPENLLFCLVV